MMYFAGSSELVDMGRGYMKAVVVPPRVIAGVPIQVQVTEIRAGERVSQHRHLRQTEVISGLSGSCTFVFGAEEVSLAPGAVVVVEPGDVHGARNDSGRTCSFLTVKIDFTGDEDTDWNLGGGPVVAPIE